MTTPLRVCSSGGGVQSTALLVLSAQREIDFPIHYFSNVGDDSEHPDTLTYVREIAMPYAEKHGIEYYELRKRPRGGEQTLMQKLMDPNGRSIGIPVFMAGGAPGRRQCTAQFKIQRVAAHVKVRGASVANPSTLAIGISFDEALKRTNLSQVPWQINAYPLIELRLTRTDCVSIIERAGLPVPPKSSCFFCLSGETEVVTREGIRRIADLAGQDVELLVPTVGTQGGLGEQCGFRRAPVRSFGVQRLWRITMRRGRAKRDVFATAGHRWILAANKAGYARPDAYERVTETLKPGDLLKSAHAMAMVKENLYPFPIAQGFVFGDGAVGQGRRPATVDFHGAKKAMTRYFHGYELHAQDAENGNESLHIHGLPRTWKSLPDINESRSFLYSWLAGYFAADGFVSEKGQASFDGATRENLEFVRSAFAVIGVSASSVRFKMRLGKGTEVTPIYTLTFNPRDVSPEFFLNDHHRVRIERRLATTEARNPRWVVASVELTERIEEVFCATVDGVGAFGLADGLLTGNCPFHGLAYFRKQKRDEPDLFARSVALETRLNEKRDMLGKDHVYLTQAGRPLIDAVGEYEQPDLFENGASCDVAGYCMS